MQHNLSEVQGRRWALTLLASADPSIGGDGIKLDASALHVLSELQCRQSALALLAGADQGVVGDAYAAAVAAAGVVLGGFRWAWMVCALLRCRVVERYCMQ